MSDEEVPKWKQQNDQFCAAAQADSTFVNWMRVAYTTPESLPEYKNACGFTRLETAAKVIGLFPENFASWDGLLHLLPRGAPPQEILGVEYTRLMCAQKCVTLVLHSNQHAKHDTDDGDEEKQKKQRATEAALVWCNLGAALMGDETTEIDGQRYSAASCYCRALESDLGYATAWGNLSALVEGNETITVAGQEYTSIEIAGMAVKSDPEDGRSWLCLGMELTAESQVVGALNDRKLDRMTCFMKAAELESNYARCWQHLGAELKMLHLRQTNGRGPRPTVNIKGETVDRKVCALKRQALRPTDIFCLFECIHVYDSPTERLTLVGSEEPVSEIELAQIILNMHWNPNGRSSDADVNMILADCWKTLMFAVDTPTIQGKQYTQVEGLAEAVKSDPHYGIGWVNLGVACHQAFTSVSVNGKEYDRDACYAEALNVWHDKGQFMPGEAQAWVNLGSNMRIDRTVTIRGTKYNKLQCIAKCLEVDETMASGWSELGILLCARPSEIKIPDDFAVTFKQEQVASGLRCFAIAIEVAPMAEEGKYWFNLGHYTEEEDSFELKFCGETVRLTPKDCYLKAVTLIPNDDRHWCRLAGKMRANEKITINGVEYTAADMYEKGHMPRALATFLPGARN